MMTNEDVINRVIWLLHNLETRNKFLPTSANKIGATNIFVKLIRGGSVGEGDCD